MKRLFLIAHLNDFSGANRSLVDLALGLKEYFDVTVIIPRSGELVEELQRRAIRYKVVPSASWVFMKDESPIKRLVKKLVNIVGETTYYFLFKREKPDLIHFNSSIYGCGAKTATKLGIPYTWHVRELAEENFHLTFFNRDKAISLINASAKILTISEFMKAKISSELDRSKIEVIYNGLFIDKEEEKEIAEPSDYSFVLVGAIAEDKGQLDAMRAFKLLIGNTKVDSELVFVGAVTDPEYYNLLQNEITDDIKERVRFVGFTKDISAYRTPNYIALICSKGEAFGRVTIEAFKSRQLVIGSNTGANLEIIRDNENGLLYQQGNPIDFAGKMFSLLMLDADAKKAMRNSGYHTLCDSFNEEKTIESCKRVFDEVIERRD